MANQQIGGSTVTYNGAIPSGGPVAISAVIEIVGNDVLVDLKLDYATGKISGVQTLYIDLRDFLGDVTVTMPDTGQRITARAGTQGYYPVLSTNLMKFIVSATIDGKFPINFINFPIALGVWPSGIKGDPGKQGDPGPAGGNVIVEDADSGDGESLLDTDDPAKILVKNLEAGDGINIVDWGESLEIVATGGGGGGGGGLTQFMERQISNGAGGGAIAANTFANFNISNGLALHTIGSELVATSDGITLGSSGVYSVNVNVDVLGKSSGMLKIRVQHQSTSWTETIDLTANTNNGNFSRTGYIMRLGMAALDTIKFAICHSTDELTNYIVKVNVAKIG